MTEFGILRKPGKAASKSLDSELENRLRCSQGIARHNFLGHSHEGHAQEV